MNKRIFEIMQHFPVGISAAIWAVLGDSITSLNYAETPYWKVISNANNTIPYNYGISGSRIAMWGGHDQPMCTRYANVTDDADIITVFGALNFLCAGEKVKLASKASQKGGAFSFDRSGNTIRYSTWK
ncbi:hypothetical protein Bmyc01_23550 [Bacillus mycoides]|nr:hypothetical protein Bmyc01_23550 [Bacillus mycoides]